MNVSAKSLQKQLIAAIAMVLVAAIALSSATYAWFVSNNRVTATTSSISAQSNAPFLVIKAGSEVTTDTVTTEDTTTPAADKVLFPVQMVEANAEATTFKWQSAYAAASDASTEKASTRFVVQSADYDKYFMKETFYVGTNGTTKGQFKNLRVSGVSVTPGVGANNEIKEALRVMVVCGAEVAIYDQAGNLVTQYTPQSGTATNIVGLTAATLRKANGVDTTAAYLTGEDSSSYIGNTDGTANSVKVDVYVYYDGAVANINTANIANLGSVKATVAFTADDAAASTTGA